MVALASYESNQHCADVSMFTMGIGTSPKTRSLSCDEPGFANYKYSSVQCFHWFGYVQF